MHGLTSIIILTWNQLAYTRQCVQSILAFTDVPYEIILVDNGSTDGTPAYLKSVPRARVMLNQFNHGFARGCNYGISMARGENILLLNNDTVVTPNWLGNMVACLRSREDIGLVGPYSNYVGSGNQMEVSYGTISEMIEFAGAFNRPDPLKWREHTSYWLSGFCLLMKREVPDRVGLLDEDFEYGGWEDVDYSIRVAREGYKLYLAGDVFIHHYGSRSFAGNGLCMEEIMKGNNRLFDLKHGL